MHRLLYSLSCEFLVTLCLVGDAGAATAVLNRYTGSFVASGTVLEGPSANLRQVTCFFSTLRQGQTGLSLRGTCSAYLIITRSVSVDLEWDPHSGQVTGSYSGSRVGTAQLTGRQIQGNFYLTINWPKPLYGDTTAELRVSIIDPDRFRIVVMDHIGVDGPVRATTDLILLRR